MDMQSCASAAQLDLLRNALPAVVCHHSVDISFRIPTEASPSFGTAVVRLRQQQSREGCVWPQVMPPSACREDWQRRPPDHRSHMMVVPVLCPHYGHLSGPPGGPQACVSAPTNNVALVPGLPTGKPTKLPVIAALVLAWSAAAHDGPAVSAGYSLEKEQIVYALAEQACMVLWNCL